MGAGKGYSMAIKIRHTKDSHPVCNSCKSNGAKFYDIGIGPIKGTKQVTTLCDTCMHTLLQKLIIVGSDKEWLK